MLNHQKGSGCQSKLKKSGPVKALGTSVYTTNEKLSDMKGSHLKNKEEHSKKSKKHGSKDDNLMDTTGKIKWKANPYATLKMWRPITMSTSITSEDDVYQNFTNFQNLQELSDSLESKESVFHCNTNGNVTYPVKLNSHIQPLSIAIPEEMQHEASRPCRQQSVSENSYNIISLSATDSVKEVLAKLYTTHDFENAYMDIDRFLTELKYTLESLQNSWIDKHNTQFNFCKEELITQTKLFVNDAKLLVSSANNTEEKLAHYLNVAMHTLAKLFLHSQSVMLMMESIHSAQNLGLEVIKVSHAFKSTVTAASAAVGKPLADPHMKYLMRQAVNLAGLLSVLLKSLRALQSTEN